MDFINSDLTVVKRKQQRGSSMMDWAGTFDQTIIKLFKVDKTEQWKLLQV